MLTTLPLLQASAAPCVEALSEPLASPVGKENTQWGVGGQPGSTPSIVGRFVGVPTLISHHGDCRGTLWGPTTGNLTGTEKGGRVAIINTEIMASWVHTCNGQAVVPTSLIPEGQMLSSSLWIEAEEYSFSVSNCLLSAAHGNREERQLNFPELSQF